MSSQIESTDNEPSRLLTAERVGIFDFETESERLLRQGFYRFSAINFFFLLASIVAVYLVSIISVLAAWFLWNVALSIYFFLYFKWNRRMRIGYSRRLVSSRNGWKQTPILSDWFFVFYALLIIVFFNIIFALIQRPM